MHFFEVFGRRLRSEIAFPELVETTIGPPDWTLRLREDLVRGPDDVQIGAIDFGQIEVRLFRSPDGFRFESDETGAFHIRDGGRSVEWAPTPGADPGLARIDLLNRVLPVALHASGTLCLHGSGVVLPAGAICFLAPKLHGKSTLAMAFASRGAPLLSDDTLAFDLVGTPRVRPGVHSLRLRADSAERFAPMAAVRCVGGEGKTVLAPVDDARIARSPAALAALYLLAPRLPAKDGPPARRIAMDTVLAPVALVGQSRLGGLFDGVEHAVILDRVIQLTAAVSVYRLEVDRDFERLDSVVDEIAGWHGGLAAVAAGRGAG
jgi:hypothetical protein